MAGMSPTVDATGITAPTFDDILQTLQDAYRSLYGADIYLEADSQDGQLLSLFATAIRDANDSNVAVYNDFSPATAQGAGLSSVVKTNGITRNIATNSTCPVRLIGQQGAVIVDGLVGDNLNLATTWALPSPITIPAAGEITVTAVCTVLGSVTASAHTLTQVVNPQFGWQTADNDVAAEPGAPVESDALLRRRQAHSAALPAQTTLNGIYAAVADVADVHRAQVFENDHGYTDERGIPAHSIAVCHEGGDSFEVAVAVAMKKPPGVQTYGTSHVVVVDPRGVPNTINLYPVANTAIGALVQIRPDEKFISTTIPYIQATMSAFYGSLEIGESAYLSRAYGAANLMTQESEDATGFSEAQLATLSATYHVLEIAQRRQDMLSNSEVPGPDNFVYPNNMTNFAVGKVIYIQLDDVSYHQAVITESPGGGRLNFSPATPIGRAIPLGAPVWVVGDLDPTEFYAAYYADPAAIVVTV